MSKNIRFFYISLIALFLMTSFLWAGEGPQSQPTSQAAVGAGSITGTLGYPSDAIPPLLVYAFLNEDHSKYQKVETGKNQSKFTISNLAPGAYVVVAYPKTNDPLQGGYSQAVPCGLLASCKDHSLIPVTVEAGKVATGVKVTDWYAPENSFPPKP